MGAIVAALAYAGLTKLTQEEMAAGNAGGAANKPAMKDDSRSIEAPREMSCLAASSALKEDFNSDGAVFSYLFDKEITMKFTTIALATAFTLTSTLAFAQAPGLGGYGTVTAPSIGSYTASVGTTNVPLTWRNTGAAAPLPKDPTVGGALGNSFAPIGAPFLASNGRR